MWSFSRKTVYIIGASSGLGLASAKLLARRGANIALFARRDLSAVRDEVLAQCVSPDQTVVIHQMDVTSRHGVEAIIDQVAKTWHQPDFVIHCAGIPGPLPFYDEGSDAQFDRVIRTNLLGTQHVCRAVLPWLEQTQGRLMLVGSMAGIIGCYGYSAYGASKYAIHGLAEALRYEYKPRGVSVGLFAPGEFASPLLEQESRQVHPATRLLKMMAGHISLNHAAYALVKALPKRQRFRITPGFLSRTVLFSRRLLPEGWVHAIGDRLVAKALARHPNRR